MKRFTLRRVALIGAILLIFAAIPVTLLIWGAGLPAQYEETFLGELKYKVRLLRETPGPRIILVGGSGTAFGADSRLIEQELEGYHVVNFGMYAALGTTVMMDLSEPFIREGDIVLLIPEQQQQTLSGWFDPAVMWQGLDGAFDLLRYLPGEKLKMLLGTYPEFAGQKFSYYVRGIPPRPEGVYCKASFNEWGDVASGLCGQNIMPGGADQGTPILFDEELLSNEFVQRVRTYDKAVRKRGGKLWYGLCPMNRLAMEGTIEEADAFYEVLQQRLRIPLAGDPRSFLMEAGWFYDTNFHPNQSGKMVYTRALVRAIKAMLGDSSLTEIELPSMPSMAETILLNGNDEDEACFTAREQGGLAVITGLTPEGRGRLQLTVPSSWKGMPVTSIAAGAFTGAERLKQIRIQPNIRTIEDDAFHGCESLEQILMEQDTPSACRVGQRLLEGTSAQVYVPEGSLSAYRTDYFWSVYGLRIHPDPG